MAKVNPQYRAAIEQIKIDADNYADQQMQTTYKNQKDHLTELHKFIGLLYIKYAVEGLLSKLTLQQKKAIAGSVDNTLKAMAKDMGQTQVDNITAILKHNYSDTYYKNAYVMDSGLKVNLKFDILKDEYINAAINNPIDGEIFSKRIWSNTANIADKLKQAIAEAMTGDTTIDAIGKDIQEIFNVNAYNAMRLVNTENARVQSQAIDDIANSTGVKQQMYSATLDNKTSEECAALDGKFFDIDDPDKVVPPENHPNCRCVLINVPFEGWQPSVRKDNELKDVIDYRDYNDWLNDKVNNSGNDDTNSLNSDIISNNKWLNSDFSTEKKFNKHIEKHLDKYGDITPEEYLNSARELLASSLSKDVEGFVSKDGFIFKYRKSTNDFAIGRADGKISTLFKPEDGYKYWLQQIKDYKEE